ncbi:MAG: hypothetical protein OHK0022_41970 [Roseiflexaceae bacterium]
MGAVMMYGFLAALLVIMTRPLWAGPEAPLRAVPQRLLWMLLALALLLFALGTAQSEALTHTFQNR